MTRIRWKLFAAMLAVVAVAIGITATVTRRVTHEQVRRLLVSGPSPSPNGLAARAGKDFIIVNDRDQVVARSSALRGDTIRVDGNHVSVSGIRANRRMQLDVHMPAMPIAGTTSRMFLLPSQHDADLEVREIELVDRRLLVAFGVSALVALLLAIWLSRRITRPLEQLASAMAAQPFPERVVIRGNDEIATLGTSFNRMTETIADQQELRKRLIGDVAHELRTPLTNLRCELEAIQDGLRDADPMRIESLYEEVRHLQRLVEDLQELAVAEAGGLRLEARRVDLADVVKRAASPFRGVVTNADTVFVDADPTRVTQIIRNLLSNAVSHTKAGQPISVRVRRENSHAIVSVSDRGAGIPHDELERIFERFYRVDESRERGRGGAGLGLAIVRALVELHGGRVWAESAPGEGATFTFTLPVASS